MLIDTTWVIAFPVRKLEGAYRYVSVDFVIVGR